MFHAWKTMNTTNRLEARSPPLYMDGRLALPGTSDMDLHQLHARSLLMTPSKSSVAPDRSRLRLALDAKNKVEEA